MRRTRLIIGAAVAVGFIAVGAALATPDDDVTATVADGEPGDRDSTDAAAVGALVDETVPDTVAPVEPAPTAGTLGVARVIDGDTVEMTDGSTVRLIGIDAPEQGECGFAEATSTLEMIVFGQSVTLTPGARDDVDRYGRLLRYLDLGTGVDANLTMIEAGQAIARYDSRDGYGGHPREERYVAADIAAAPYCAATLQPAVAVPAVAPAPVAPAPAAPAAPPSNVSYANCDAVRAAGAAPIREGDPGWDVKFDRDRDGVGCE